MALKSALAPVLLLPLVLRRWAPFLTGVLAAGAATLVGALVAGWDASLEWLRIARDLVPADSVDNASLPGLAMRFGLPAVVGAAAGLTVMGGTLWWIARHRERVDPAGTTPWAVLAAGLLLSPFAWHNYLMLLWPGVLVVLASGRRGVAAAMLAVAVVPVSWNAILPPDGPAAAVGRSLYCAILVSYWLVLLAPRRVPVHARSVTGAGRGPRRGVPGQGCSQRVELGRSSRGGVSPTADCTEQISPGSAVRGQTFGLNWRLTCGNGRARSRRACILQLPHSHLFWLFSRKAAVSDRRAARNRTDREAPPTVRS